MQPVAMDTPAQSAAAAKSETKRARFLRQASLPTHDDQAPVAQPRWMIKGDPGIEAKKSARWNPVTDVDNADLEAAWAKWRESQTKSTTVAESQSAADDGHEEEAKAGIKRAPWDPTQPVPDYICPIGEDHLWEADFRDSRVYPAFWPGPPLEIVRATWFYDGAAMVPVSEALAAKLEEHYHTVRPYSSIYSHELSSALELGAEAEAKLACPLDGVAKTGTQVIFLGPVIARIYPPDFGSRIAKSIWTAVSGEHGGGQLISRGYAAAASLEKSYTKEQKDGRKDTAMNARERETTEGDAPREEDSVRDPAASLDTDRDHAEDAVDVSEAKSNPFQLMERATRRFWDTSREAAKAKVAAAVKNQTVQADMLAALDSTDPDPSQRGAAGQIKSVLVERLRTIAKAADQRLAEPVSSILQVDATQSSDEIAEARKALNDKHEGVDQEGKSSPKPEALPPSNPEAEPLVLVMVLHGIGQRLATSVESWGFSKAINGFRELVRERAATTCEPVVQGQRIQFIPILWRAALDSAEEEHQHDPNGEFPDLSLDDIMGDQGNIPYIRQIIKGVLLDIPLYLTPRHHEVILQKVVAEMNRVYALFRQRNPRRTGAITVNLISHSLGAALSIDVLSKQPSRFDQGPSLLRFDVDKLYLIGSPAALFLWLAQKTLVARDERTKDPSAKTSPPRYGCLAVNEVWNLVYGTDPVATRLNCCISVPGKHHPPIRATDVIDSILAMATGEDPASLKTGSVMKRFSGPPSFLPFMAKFQKPKESDESAENEVVMVVKEDSEARPSPNAAHQDELRAARATFTALNPLGSVDYRLPTVAASSLLSNDYLNSAIAHGAYWGDHSFVKFLLVTTFAERETLHGIRARVSPNMWEDAEPSRRHAE